MYIKNAEKAFSKEDLFYCYSPRLKAFLNKKGIQHVAKGRNEKTNKIFWLFLRSDLLSEALDEWKEKSKK